MKFIHIPYGGSTTAINIDKILYYEEYTFPEFMAKGGYEVGTRIVLSEGVVVLVEYPKSKVNAMISDASRSKSVHIF